MDAGLTSGAGFASWRTWFAAMALLGVTSCSGSSSGTGGESLDGDASLDERDGSDEGPTSCGDGVLDIGERCDDGNRTNGDGCTENCLIEPGFVCSESGAACESTCGDGIFDDGEACDDGNIKGGDGCSASCQVEEGFGCPRPDVACIAIPVCGNGTRERGEACDSGKLSDPGCIDCQIQPGFWCTTPGDPCIAEICGNGVRTPDEACDDGGTDDGDGCSATCEIEAGFRCTSSGCRAICGDGELLGDETCDDGNTLGGDGCSAGCRVEFGKSCSVPGEPCVDAVCGNSLLEGGEGCDDGNVIAGDGCGPTCQLEPTVTVGPNPVVNVRCGDGLITSGEACDDGNVQSGDGCSDACKIEEGFDCDDMLTYPGSVRFRVTYRDFMGRSESGGHPHMRTAGSTTPPSGSDRGIVGSVCTSSNTASCGRLDVDGKPALAPGTHPTVNTDGGNTPEAFGLWYRNTNTTMTGANGVIAVTANPGGAPAGGDSLLLNRVAATEAYRFDSANFFPLNGRGYLDTPDQSNNFHFTTELRSFFQYKGGETLSFRGDDDVWVYINGRLAVDIGGNHGPEWGRVVLGDDGAPGGGDSDCSVGNNVVTTEPAACTQSAAEAADNQDSRFGLVKGNVYEIVLFHAERHPTGSNFRLTLTGFLSPKTYCTPICGDGKVVGPEACDDGDKNADGVYNVCNTSCSGRTYCGDNIVEAGHEACDNGFNLDAYASGIPNACAPGCKLPPTCGDGVVQAPYEFCDDGEDNADDAYDGCNTQCAYGPFCGDGQIDPGETCDDGLGPNGNTSQTSEPGRCGYDCQPAFVIQ